LRFEKHMSAAVRSAQFHPSGKTLITAGVDGVARFWDVDGNVVAEHRDPDMPISAAYDASGSRGLSSVSHGAAKIWDATTGATDAELVGHKGLVITAAWSPDGRMAITVGADGTERIWDAATGDNVAVYVSQAAVASFSPDGRHVVIGGDLGIATLV